jgi:hypothetical protein
MDVLLDSADHQDSSWAGQLALTGNSQSVKVVPGTVTDPATRDVVLWCDTAWEYSLTGYFGAGSGCPVGANQTMQFLVDRSRLFNDAGAEVGFTVYLRGTNGKRLGMRISRHNPKAGW